MFKSAQQTAPSEVGIFSDFISQEDLGLNINWVGDLCKKYLGPAEIPIDDLADPLL